MWPVSDRYLATWARSHTQVAYLQVLLDGDVITSLLSGRITDPDSGLSISTIGGSISVANSMIRRSASMEFTDPTGKLMPIETDDFLVPYRTEIRVWVGMQYWDSSSLLNLQSIEIIDPRDPSIPIEFVPVGTFVVTNPQQSGRTMTFQGYDRMWLLDTFTAPYTVAAGTPIIDALNNLIALSVPVKRLSTDFPDTEFTVAANLTFDANSSISEAVQRVGALAGWSVYVNPMGMFTASTPPSTDDDPDLVLSDGSFSTLVNTGRDVGSGEVKNAVVYTSEGTQSIPFRGYAQDSNPDSLTNIDLIGVRAAFFSDPGIGSQEQADAAARAQLMSVVGLSDTYTVSMIPFHALEIDDLLSLTDSTKNLVSKNVVVDNFNVPIRASDGVMTAQCRGNVVIE